LFQKNINILNYQGLKMHIFQPQLEIGDEEGFSTEKDIFNLKEFGQSLMDLNERVEDPLVIALDGPWGSGKSTFIKMWLGLLRQNNFPVIYFDAFVNDHIEDAFTAIAGEVIALADENDAEGNTSFKDKAVNASKVLLKSGLKIGVKGLTLGALNQEDLEDLKSISGDIAKEASEITDKYLKDQLENHTKERAMFDEFRSSLEELSSNLSKNIFEKNNHKTDGDAEEILNPPNRPLIFVIDELDRCKPPFALALLEKIKHFFSVKGVNFLLVTNLDQLKNCVKYSYGNEDEEAKEYLQRFYHLATNLPEKLNRPGHEDIINFLRILFDNFPKYSDDPTGNNYCDELIECFSEIALTKDLSLRTIEKISTHLALFIATTNINEYRDPYLLACLCTLKIVDPEMYSKAKNNELTFLEFENFFSLSRREWIDEVYKCIFGEMKESVELASHFRRLGIMDIKKTIPLTCKKIDLIKFSE
jgi:hypothetical protein